MNTRRLIYLLLIAIFLYLVSCRNPEVRWVETMTPGNQFVAPEIHRKKVQAVTSDTQVTTYLVTTKYHRISVLVDSQGKIIHVKHL